MAQKLTFEYDREGDILYIGTCQPYAEQDSEEIEDYLVARLNPTTGEIENLEVLFFSKRMEDNKKLELPIDANLHLSA